MASEGIQQFLKVWKEIKLYRKELSFSSSVPDFCAGLFKNWAECFESDFVEFRNLSSRF